MSEEEQNKKQRGYYKKRLFSIELRNFSKRQMWQRIRGLRIPIHHQTDQWIWDSNVGYFWGDKCLIYWIIANLKRGRNERGRFRGFHNLLDKGLQSTRTINWCNHSQQFSPRSFISNSPFLPLQNVFQTKAFLIKLDCGTHLNGREDLKSNQMANPLQVHVHQYDRNNGRAI